MTRSARRLPPVPLFIGIAIVALGGFAFATYQVWANDLALADRGQQTTARVTEVGRERITVAFRTADGREVETLVGQGDEAPGPLPAPGDELPIVYDPQRPTSEVRDTRAPENHKVGWLLLATTVAGTIGVCFATPALIRARRRQAT
jgi:hypothetical protein